MITVDKANQIKIEDTVLKVIESARTFVLKHSDEKLIQQTFGFYTQHTLAALNQKRLRLILQSVQKIASRQTRPLRILDLGCGGGITTCALSALGHRVLGFDQSSIEIRLARLFAQEFSWNGMFETSDLIHDSFWERKALETLGGKPDIVILAHALHHIPKVEFFVDRLSRWLDSGAYLLINEENPYSPLFQIKRLFRSLTQKETDTDFYKSFREWQSILEKLDFNVDQSSFFGTDFLPAIARIKADICWSIIFAARRK